MGRSVNQLSTKWIERDDLKPGLYCDGNGLYLQVSDRLTKAWVFRFMIRGRARKMGLGHFGNVSLKEARRNAHVARLLVVDGIRPDPGKKRQESRASG